MDRHAPMLDPEICYRAMRSRDRRFEGRFVIAVTSTGIYCRPGCPAKTPALRNVRFLPGAAAAELAGFRACRRCRPDAALDSPAGNGTSVTVTRALRLIDEGALDGGGVEALAARLGMGGRHLRRLFLDHLGAPPAAVAGTRRAHFARKLIEETNLPLAAVATAAGFGSVRRFNASLRRTFRCAPRDFRRRRARPADTGGLALKLPFRPPLDWESLLAFLAARAIPGVEQVEGDRYRRTFRAATGPAVLEVSPLPGEPALRLRLGVPPGAGLERIVRRVRRLFDLDADPVRIGSDLARDPLLAAAVRARPGLRVPGAWNGFETAVRAVLGQQVSVRGATTLAGRLVAMAGERIASSSDGLTHLFPEPAAVAAADLSRCGLPAARAACLKALARAAEHGELPLDGAQSLEEAVERLQSLPGVGPWTAHYIAMRALGEPDAFPAGDLVLKQATGLTEARLIRRSESWRPWRAYATMHLWRQQAQEAKRVHKAKGARRGVRKVRPARTVGSQRMAMGARAAR